MLVGMRRAAIFRVGELMDPNRRRRSRGHVIYSQPGMPLADRATDAAEEQTGSAFELVGATVAAALTIIGLLGFGTLHTAAFSAIAVGFALFAHGGTLATRWTRAKHMPEREKTEAIGLGTEVVGGFAVIVLGVIAASDVAPLYVLPAASLVIGAALLLGGPTQPALAVGVETAGPRWRVTRDAVRASGGVMAMAGVAAIVLGILSLTGGPVLTLTLVAFLCVATALLVAGTALTARIAQRLA
jgi:hypothetical protein